MFKFELRALKYKMFASKSSFNKSLSLAIKLSLWLCKLLFLAAMILTMRLKESSATSLSKNGIIAK